MAPLRPAGGNFAPGIRGVRTGVIRSFQSGSGGTTMNQGAWTDARNGLPTVSVIVPAYSASGTIANTLQSIFSQSRQDFEVVVVDDGSPDRAALQSAMGLWRGAIRVLFQPNRGAGAARNLALLHARGRYV